MEFVMNITLNNNTPIQSSHFTYKIDDWNISIVQFQMVKLVQKHNFFYESLDSVEHSIESAKWKDHMNRLRQSQWELFLCAITFDLGNQSPSQNSIVIMLHSNSKWQSLDAIICVKIQLNVLPEMGCSTIKGDLTKINSDERTMEWNGKRNMRKDNTRTETHKNRETNSATINTNTNGICVCVCACVYTAQTMAKHRSIEWNEHRRTKLREKKDALAICRCHRNSTLCGNCLDTVNVRKTSVCQKWHSFHWIHLLINYSVNETTTFMCSGDRWIEQLKSSLDRHCMLEWFFAVLIQINRHLSLLFVWQNVILWNMCAIVWLKD